MTRKEIIQQLHTLETDYPVNEWVIDGIHVWPIMKIDLFYRWFDLNNKKDTVLNNKKPSGFQYILKVVVSFYNLIRLLVRPPSKKNGILFSDADNFRERIDGKFLNRYFQPMIAYLKEEKQDWDTIFFSGGKKPALYPKEENIYFALKYYYGIRLFSLLNRKKKQVHLPYFDALITSFSEEVLEVDPQDYKKFITDKVDKIKIYEYLSNVIIDKYNIKVAFELCYYSHERYGLNLATRKKGIPVYEIQHGGMGSQHVAYSAWDHIPSEGYGVMPKTFWLWDEVSYNLLNDWIPKQNFHHCILGGNPWFDYLFSHRKQSNFQFPKDKKIILYTLQYAAIDEYILKTIKNTPAVYQWWIRLHPRKTEAKPYILQSLKEWGIFEKVEIDRAVEYPLPVILKHAGLHISGFSGAIIEAAQLKVVSIIIEETGVAFYQPYIDQGMAVAETYQSSEALLQCIHDSARKGSKNNQTKDLHARYKIILNKVLKDF